MPDISASQDLIDATFFLYPSADAARVGEKFGGSGVIVGVPLESRSDLVVPYAVTNWHVAVHGGSSVIRINDSSGGVRIIETDPSDWTFLPGKQDLAAIHLKLPADIQAKIVPSTLFITDTDKVDAHVGDDVFMVGRFIDYDGHETNRPALRFGAISMMDAPVRQPTGFEGRSIIVDMHSRTGFSGSPVYVYRPGGVTVVTEADWSGKGFPVMAGPKASHRKWGIGNNVQVRLLGLQWGQFPEAWEVLRAESPAPAAHGAVPLVQDGGAIRGFSGMSCVVPASQIIELLNVPQLKLVRDVLNQFHSTSHIPHPE